MSSKTNSTTNHTTNVTELASLSREELLEIVTKELPAREAELLECHKAITDLVIDDGNSQSVNTTVNRIRHATKNVVEKQVKNGYTANEVSDFNQQ